MSVITFYGNNKIETAQTTSMAAIATYLSIEKDYKILLINTKHNDDSLKECFWSRTNNMHRNDIDTGIIGLIKAISSNKSSPEIITNYTKTVFKGRLEVLTSNNVPKEDYEKQKKYMANIVKMANKYYDLVFVDLEGSLVEQYVDDILKTTDLIVANTSQRIKFVKEFLEQKVYSENIKDENTIILIGKYDQYSKYNIKNLKRTNKIQEICGIPYNTLFFEACNEGKLADFMINFRKVKLENIQGPVIEAISEVGNKIVDKLKEIPMHF